MPAHAGPGGQQETITHAPLAIDDRDLDVAAECIVLQTVVGNHDIGVGVCQQSLDGRRTIRSNTHRPPGTGGNHHRLVADYRRITVTPDLLRPAGCCTTVAA